jgi:hypothetical protein
MDLDVFWVWGDRHTHNCGYETWYALSYICSIK